MQNYFPLTLVKIQNAKIIKKNLKKKKAFNTLNSFMSSTSTPTQVNDASNHQHSSSTTNSPPQSYHNQINMSASMVPGFQLMQVYFAKNAETVELYYLLFALLFDAQRVKELPSQPLLDLNSICKYVFDKSFDSEQSLFCRMNTDISLDLTLILFSMIRSLMNPHLANEEVEETTNDAQDQPSSEFNNIKDYAIILLQIFRFMYHNSDDFRAISSDSAFLAYLIATLYPTHDLSIKELASPSPVEIKPFVEAMCNGPKSDDETKSPNSHVKGVFRF